MEKFDLEERLIRFSVNIVDIVGALPDTRVGNHVAGQLLRSGTSPAPNYGEAQSAESRRDFIHKMKISLKELRESYIWLKVIKYKTLIDDIPILDRVLTENDELISIFVSSVMTAQRNLGAQGISSIEQGVMK